MLSMRNLCYPQDLYVKKRKRFNIYIDIYIQEQDATLFDITRWIFVYIYVCKKKTNRKGERLVYNCPQNLVIQNDVV